MKTLICCLTLFAVATLTLVQGQMRADIDQDIPLAGAILQANTKYPDVQPLTEEEVIAAVRAIRVNHPDIKDAVYDIYQRVVNERLLPRGMYFSHIPEWETQYGHFEVDWKDLTLDLDHAGITGEKPGKRFNYRIRARFISSRPLTDEEARAKRISSVSRRSDAVYSAQFSPDGKRIVTTSPDRTARIWDVQTGQPIAPAGKGISLEGTKQTGRSTQSASSHYLPETQDNLPILGSDNFKQLQEKIDALEMRVKDLEKGKNASGR